MSHGHLILLSCTVRMDRVRRLSPTDVGRAIIAEVRLLLRERGEAHPREIELDTSLVDELAFDSWAFIELTMRLEKRLDIDELPLQDWIDRESSSRESNHTVRSLAAFAQDFVATGNANDG